MREEEETMNRMRMMTGALLAVTFSLLSACCPDRQTGVSVELLAAIDSFYAAIASGDHEARVALFGDSALMLPNHWTMTRGKAGIADMIRSSAGYEFKLKDREVVDIGRSGDLAYTVNSYWYSWHEVGAEPQWHKTKNVHIWKRDTAGKWKLHTDIWNSDVPMSAFAEE
jgi:ketosteroid isomerase-like protein